MNGSELPSWLPIWWLESFGWTFALFFLAALTEMLFPPFPGDTIFFVGLIAAQAVGGSIVGALAATLLGGLSGFVILYWLGRSQGRRLFRKERSGLFALKSLERVEGWFRRWGGLVLLFGRFLSGVRSVVPISAGVSAYPIPGTLILGALSIVLWNGILAALALLLHENWSTVSHFWNTYSFIFWTAAVVFVLILIWRALRRRRVSGEGTSP
ncbi:MAG TPA: DedA family protein [Acidobacteriota bacterium]|nr:DedA family protein [Acidobacteriota bacterium]